MLSWRRRSSLKPAQVLIICFFVLFFAAMYLSWGHKTVSVMSQPLFKLRMMGYARNIAQGFGLQDEATLERDAEDLNAIAGSSPSITVSYHKQLIQQTPNRSKASRLNSSTNSTSKQRYGHLFPGLIDSPVNITKHMRSRAFDRLTQTHVPWEDKPVKTTVLGYPEKDTLGCNPMSMSCACLKEWYGRDVCLDLAHRQKQRIKLIFKEDAWWMPNDLDIGDHDCPTTQCQLILGKEHDKEADAFISPLKPGRFFPTISFPPKHDRKKNFNIMLNFESSIKYKMLLDPFFYAKYDIDVYGSHTGWPVPKHLLANGSLSFVELSDLDRPASPFRKHGPAFAERSDHVALFVSHCVGTRMRSKILAEIAKHITIYSFGSCTPPLAKKAKVADVYPMCANLSTVGKMAEKECVLSYSKFSLSIENVQEHNYVTEKLYQALAMGAIPIYWGAPNAQDLIPHANSALIFTDLKDIQPLMARVKNISASEEVWNNHTRWKDGRFSDGFLGLIRHQRGSMFCRLCEHIAEKQSQFGVTLVQQGLSLCAAEALLRVVNAPWFQGMPLGDPYAWAGLDAAVILRSHGGSDGTVTSDVGKELATQTWSMDAGRVAAIPEQDLVCMTDSLDRGGAISFGGTQDQARLLAAGEVAIMLYAVAVEGRQNTLVVCDSDSATVSLLSGNKQAWQGLLTRVPADYDALLIHAESEGTLHSKSDWYAVKQPDSSKVGLCQGWIVSQEGARKLLRGEDSASLRLYAVSAKAR
jgi:hypothetical protein